MCVCVEREVCPGVEVTFSYEMMIHPGSFMINDTASTYRTAKACQTRNETSMLIQDLALMHICLGATFSWRSFQDHSGKTGAMPNWLVSIVAKNFFYISLYIQPQLESVLEL